MPARTYLPRVDAFRLALLVGLAPEEAAFLAELGRGRGGMGCTR
jgi:hypothetical protein